MASKRVDFTAGTFDSLITKHGLDLELHHAIRCPCLDPGTGQVDPNCPYCISGWQYYGTEEIIGVIQNISAEKQFAETGGFLLGSVMLTVPAATNLAYHDRIINRQSLVTHSEIVTRDDDGLVDKARFPVVNTIRVLGKAGVVYISGTDFTIDDDGNIEWVETGENPDSGDYYSIAYQMNPVWLCMQAPHLFRDTKIKFQNPKAVHTRLPIQSLCRNEIFIEE